MKNNKIVLFLTFPKTGSTSLKFYLENYDRLLFPKGKETWFFDDKYYNQGDKFFYKNYKVTDKKSLICDFVSTLLYEKNFSHKIKKYFPNPKIVFLIRDPIERAYSHYLHEKRDRREKASFEESIKNENNRINNSDLNYSNIAYVQIGNLYSQAAKEIKENFPKSDIHFILFEQLINNYDNTIKNLLLFLNIKYNKDFIFPKINVASRSKNLVLSFLYNSPYSLYHTLQNSEVLKIMIPNFIKNKTFNSRSLISRKLNSLKQNSNIPILKKKIKKETFNSLKNNYNNKLKNLDDIININLSKYWDWYED
tara:strand:+ start:4741 stop:5667 length:927 start_codon:yes stop_codon:yes gene_type:complete